MARREQGRVEEAIDCLQRGITLSNRHPWPMLDLADVFMLSGRVGDAARLADEILARAASDYVSPQVVAAVLVTVKRGDEAAAWLERAYRERDTSIPLFANWPFMSSYVHDPKIREILRRIGLSRAAHGR
jgi:predicted Zn-dependent protease